MIRARGPRPDRAGVSRELLVLAVPALGALVAEPLFVLADTAMIGHLGAAQLGGTGVASTIIQTALGLLVFLAYGTTPRVSRLVGAGRMREALGVGRDGVALALGLGLALTAAGAFAGPALAEALGARGAMAPYAAEYIHGSLPGLTGMLAMFALTGVFRGLGDAKTPLRVAVAGAVANVGVNALFIYGLGLGVLGSGLGTSLVQWGMAVTLGLVLGRRMVREGVSFIPTLPGVRANAGAGVWLVLRSVTMRAAILAALVVVTGWGPEAAAGHQIIQGLFMLLSLALDAIAIAAQTLIARELGASNAERVLVFLKIMLRWGVGVGLAAGAVLAACSPFVAGWFGQAQIAPAVTAAVLVLAASQPLAAVVFVLDGVLIGASDLKYLALVSIATLAVYAACLAGVGLAFPPGARQMPTAELAWLWAAWSVGFMAARAATLWVRARTGAWVRLGAD
ncbi:MATE family efflux transporter [Falsarthrobacter nasiphocae]|uniref:MATE family efflux protein n=1 Tax=Falsarthrobacter nasiphocae TaxID=189863 RepID=A0AAE3YG38_9MICC|nr:MATE family efflux transporter [Falsarthrobacter nasiphocae]MDR6892142.1 putative MATE family efflux protein [Falsarthrobacter nasiphocae]